MSRFGRWLASMLLALTPFACDGDDLDGRRAPAADRSPSPSATPALFGFVETRKLLEEREILLSPLPESIAVMSIDDFRQRLEQRMSRHPSWEVLSVHLGEVDLANPHFNRFDEPMYVVEITGPATGNCFDLYDAIEGSYMLGACFYPTRP